MTKTIFQQQCGLSKGTLPEHTEEAKKVLNDPNFTLPVPCGSCRRCCIDEFVVLTKAELSAYDWVDKRGIPVLRQKPNGECIYLGEHGCTIHGRAPFVCRSFDCRGLYLDLKQNPRHERRQLFRKNASAKRLYEAGKALQQQHPKTFTTK